MKRILVALLVAVLVVGAAVGQARDDAGPVKVDLSAGLTSSVFAAHWSVTPSAVYRLGWFGLGAGLKSHFGIGHDALYLGPYARGEIGWFYLGIGPLFLLQQPEGSEWGEIERGATVIVPAGFQIPLLPLGPGRLGADLGLDFSVTPPKVVVDEYDNIFATIIASIAATVVGAVVGTIKVNAGLFYSFRI